MAARGERQVAFVSETFGVLDVRRQHLIQNLGHCARLLFGAFQAERVSGN